MATPTRILWACRSISRADARASPYSGASTPRVGKIFTETPGYSASLHRLCTANSVRNPSSRNSFNGTWGAAKVCSSGNSSKFRYMAPNSIRPSFTLRFKRSTWRQPDGFSNILFSQAKLPRKSIGTARHPDNGQWHRNNPMHNLYNANVLAESPFANWV